MKDHLHVSGEDVRTEILSFAEARQFDKAFAPIFEEYMRQCVESSPKIFDEPIQSLAVDPLLSKQINAERMPELGTQFLILAVQLGKLIMDDKLTEEVYKSASLNACLMYDKMIILEVGRRYGSMAIDMDALFKVTSESFDNKFKEKVFLDISHDEHVKIFSRAFNEVVDLLHHR